MRNNPLSILQTLRPSLAFSNRHVIAPLRRFNGGFNTQPSRHIHSRASEYLPSNLPEWTESQRSVREAIAKICAKYPDEYWLERDTEHKFPWELYNDLAANGWLGICLPEEYGGAGLGISEAAVMLHTIAESGAGMNGASSVHMNIFGLEPVAKFGTSEQKKRWLVPLIQGKERACFGVTEPPPPSAQLRAPHYFMSASFTIDRFTPHSFACSSAIAAFCFLFICSLH
ncbi:isovaleryl- dehydrogenase [Fusarium avenaceum]|nr:isovaleryl- dehydrogenase [Fusarium avenaceum]